MRWRSGSAQYVNDCLGGGDEGIGIFGFNLVAALGLNGIDEGLQGVDGRDIVVGVDVINGLKRSSKLGIETV